MLSASIVAAGSRSRMRLRSLAVHATGAFARRRTDPLPDSAGRRRPTPDASRSARSPATRAPGRPRPGSTRRPPPRPDAAYLERAEPTSRSSFEGASPSSTLARRIDDVREEHRRVREHSTDCRLIDLTRRPAAGIRVPGRVVFAKSSRKTSKGVSTSARAFRRRRRLSEREVNVPTGTEGQAHHTAPGRHRSRPRRRGRRET
jgi:hypothetical protein